MTAAHGRTGAALETSWVDHLKDGGTTPWLDWTSAGRPVATDERPGAAQLDLLRRVNEGGPARHLAPVVLGRAAPGRGAAEAVLPDPPPPGATREGLASSPDETLQQVARTYPDVSPREEVLRLAAGVVSDLTAELDTDVWHWRPHPVRGPGRAGRRSPASPTYLLAGAPALVADLRARLAAAGAPEGGRRRLTGRADPPDVLLLVAGPFDRALADFWGWRVKMGATRSWRAVVARAAHRDEVPPTLAYDRLAAELVAPDGAAPGAVVHVVTPQALDEQVAAVLEVRPAERGEPVRRPVDPLPLVPAYVDVVRRANAVLPFQAEEPRLSQLRRALVAVLATDADPPGPPLLDVPLPHRDWLVRQAEQTAEALGSAGHVVHGDLSSVYEWTTSGHPRLSSGQVLDAVVSAVHLLDRAAARGGEARS